MIYIFWTACASLFPVESVYKWEGKVEESSETKVILKTLSKHFDQIKEMIVRYSSYEISELTAVQVERVSEKYRNFVEASV